MASCKSYSCEYLGELSLVSCGISDYNALKEQLRRAGAKITLGSWAEGSDCTRLKTSKPSLTFLAKDAVNDTENWTIHVCINYHLVIKGEKVLIKV